MSIVSNTLSLVAALAFGPNVEYQICEFIQDASKCMCHSKRTTLIADDIDSLLALRKVELIYSFTSEVCCDSEKLFAIKIYSTLRIKILSSMITLALPVHRSDDAPVDVELPIKLVLSKRNFSCTSIRYQSILLIKQIQISLEKHLRV